MGVSTAYWNATPLATTYVSPTELSAVVPAGLTAAAGMGALTVLNQPPGAGTSAPVTFSVGPPPPPIAIGAASALGLRPATGFQREVPQGRPAPRLRQLAVLGGAALAGQRVNVLVAKKTMGAWGSPAYLRLTWADAKGVVTVWMTASAATALERPGAVARRSRPRGEHLGRSAPTGSSRPGAAGTGEPPAVAPRRTATSGTYNRDERGFWPARPARKPGPGSRPRLSSVTEFHPGRSLVT